MANLIGLIGYARSGKDTVGEILVNNYGYRRLAFADPLRRMLEILNPIIGLCRECHRSHNIHLLNEVAGDLLWNKAKQGPYGDEVRRLMQIFGTEVCRQHFGPDIWIKLLEDSLDDRPTVITDIRYPNEAARLKGRGASIWKVTRPNLQISLDHSSEQFIDRLLYDVEIINSNEEDWRNTLEKKVYTLLMGMKK